VGRQNPKRCKDLGVQARLLRWEQRAGWLAVVPVRRPRLLPRRGHTVETGTVARTYPWSAGTLVLEGGVPFGVAASSPVTFTVAQPKRAGRKGWRHMCWHGSTGSGKGYQLRVYLSREHFANGLRVYVIGVVLPHLGLDLSRPEHAATIGTEHPLLMTTMVVDQAPPLITLDDLADALDAQELMVDRNAI
jgi:hypothetical protein